MQNENLQNIFDVSVILHHGVIFIYYAYHLTIDFFQ